MTKKTSAKPKKKVTLEALAQLIERGNAGNEKQFAALAEDIANLATNDDMQQVLGHFVDMHAQMNNMEPEVKPIARANLPQRTTELEKKVLGASKAPRLHGL